MRDGAAARRYARALLDVAEKQGDPGRLRRELKEAASLLASNPELERVLVHPGVPAERREAVLAAVWKRDRNDLLLRLLALLAERQRLALLPEIERRYAEAWNARRGAVVAEVVTAEKLPPGAQKALVGALARATGREVETQAEVRPEVLGGVLVRMEGRVFDGTVRGRLRSLRQTLLGGA